MFEENLGLQLLVFSVMLTISTVAIVVAYLRGRQTLRLREKLLRGQALEIAFREQALNEHALVTVTTSDGTLIDVNDRFLKRFGYTRAQMIGRPHGNFYMPGDVAKSDEIRRQTRKGQIWSGQTELRAADGSVVVTQCTVVPMIDDKGRHVKNISMRADVTENSRREAEKLITSGFDNLSAPVYVYDPTSFKICYMNKFALMEQGWTEQDVGKKTIWQTDYKPDPELIKPVTRDLLETGQSTVSLHGPRHARDYEAQLYTISAKGSDERVLVILRDISDRAAAERERQALLSVITHELRTPLTSIKGAVNLLGAGAVGPMSGKARGLISIAEKNSERMLTLIRDLLELERLEQAGAEMEMSVVDPCALVEDAIEAQQGVEFVNAGCPGRDCANAVRVRGNAERLAQVMANLMSNAAKFTPPGGKVELGVRDDGKYVTMFVTDHGPGIPKEDRAKLFDRFSQTRNSGNPGIDSSGLGLSIVKSIVEQHDGLVDFHTTLGQGTTFFVRLPRCEPEESATHCASKKTHAA